MKKRYQPFLRSNKPESSSSQTVVTKEGIKDRRNRIFNKHAKTKWKWYLLGVLAILLGVIAYIGVNSISAANNMLSSNISLGSLLKQSSLKQTDGITNILMLGKGGSDHPGGQLTDSIMLIRYREKDKKVAMISIPRDLWVTFADGGQGKINEAYSRGFNSVKNTSDTKKKQDAAATSSSKAVEKVTGINVHYYVTVDFTAFKDLVDSLGGVTVNVEKAIYDPYYPADNMVDYSPFKIAAGEQKLDGKTALKYARSRETTTDFDRAKRQQNLIYAIKEKMMSLGVLANPVKFTNSIQSLGTHISTSFGADELKELASVVTNINEDNIINKVIDNDPTTGLLVSESDGSYHLVPKTGNFSQIQKFVANIFDETSVKEATIEVYNASGVTGQGGKFAEALKAKGLNVTTIANYSSKLDKTKIENGSSNAETLTTIKSLLTKPEVTTGEEGIIKVILGKDYGN